MSEKTHAELIKEMNCGPIPEHRHDREILRLYAYELDAAHKREITVLRDALAEVVASIEIRFPVIEYALDRKPYLDAKKILEQYKEEAALATTSNQNTQEDNQ